MTPWKRASCQIPRWRAAARRPRLLPSHSGILGRCLVPGSAGAPCCSAAVGRHLGRRCAGGAAESGGKAPDATAERATASSVVQGPLSVAAVLTAVAAGAGWWMWQAPALDNFAPGLDGQEEPGLDLELLVEEVFEWADNLFVFFLDSADELVQRRDEIRRVHAALADEPSLSRLRFFYNVRKDGDPATAVPAASSSSSDVSPSGASIHIMMYKGQRKKTLHLRPAAVQEHLQDIVTFFTPAAEDLKESLRSQIEVTRTSGKSFGEDVLAQSSPDAPILLQMYEDTCFLCFLMRPFVNSLARLLRESGVNLRIKRLNLERNDFPEGCPVARGTPTFVLFRGSEVKPAKWDEFKPNQIVDKLRQDWPGIHSEVFEQLDELQRLVTVRLQLFTQTVMWTVELGKIEQLYNASETVAATDSDHPTDDASFGTTVTEMMMSDMKRHDELPQNLTYLRQTVDELEHDALLLGAMLAELVLTRERQKAES